MGYRGKLAEQAQARALRADGATLAEIAQQLGVARSSVSLWVRDVDFTPRPRRIGPVARRRGPNVLAQRKQAEIERLRREGADVIDRLSDRDLLIAGTALYAGEGSKRDGTVGFANTNASLVAFFCAWLRRFFRVDESRLRVCLYLHEGLDLDAAVRFWSQVTRPVLEAVPRGPRPRDPHREARARVRDRAVLL
jgi:transcriptional regulator with XRE-family HTH domain